MPIIQIKNLSKAFTLSKRNVPVVKDTIVALPKRDIEVLKDINLEILTGEYLLIFGPSGCGKTTLLNLILGLETPTSGKIIVHDKNLGKMTSQEKSIFRSKNFSTIFQNSYWLKSLNVLENVALPLYLRGLDKRSAKKRAHEALTIAGMHEFALSRPNELSSGEQQRVSLARAIVSDAPIIIADEPTGNLDSQAGHKLMAILDQEHRQGKTIVLVTHNLSYLVHADKKIAMEDGQIIGRFSGDSLPADIKRELKEE